MHATTARPTRDITTLPLPPTLRNKIVQAGFRDVRDFEGYRAVELAKELRVSQEDALNVLRTVRESTTGSREAPGASGPSSRGGSLLAEGKTAFEMITMTESKFVRTLCEDIDQMLGEGVPVGQLTEFCGVPGIGKTQLGMQLSVSVQIPQEFGGSGGHCIYIDTEGSFVVERVIEMANALTEFLKQQAESSKEPEKLRAAAALTTQNILRNIHYYRIHDYVEQIALLNTLPAFLKEHPEVQVVVIDSVTFHFRHDFDDFMARTRILNSMAQTLMSLAEEFSLSIVLMNQVTTKVTERGNAPEMRDSNQLVPALGESWGHACTNRVILYWRDGQRFAHLHKCPSMESKTVPFVVLPDGVRSLREQQDVSATSASSRSCLQE